MAHEYMWINSPIGKLRLVATQDALIGILWEVESANRTNFEPMLENKNNVILRKTAQQLEEYFTGHRNQFEIKLDLQGTTFQKTVWQALLTIPFGTTKTYSEIAAQIGNPKAVRAVGAASGKNPIAIIAPCHRVIGSNGKLIGFAGGLKAKEMLLAIEGLKRINNTTKRNPTMQKTFSN